MKVNFRKKENNLQDIKSMTERSHGVPLQWLCFWGKSTNETNQYQVLCYLNKYSRLSGSRLLINIKQREAEFTLDTRSIFPYAIYSMKCLKTIYTGTKLFLEVLIIV